MHGGDVGGIEADGDGGIDVEQRGTGRAGVVVEDDLGGDGEQAFEPRRLALRVADAEADADHRLASAMAVPAAMKSSAQRNRRR